MEKMDRGKTQELSAGLTNNLPDDIDFQTLN